MKVFPHTDFKWNENFAPMFVGWSCKNETSSCSNKGNVNACIYVPDDVTEIILSCSRIKKKRKMATLTIWKKLQKERWGHLTLSNKRQWMKCVKIERDCDLRDL